MSIRVRFTAITARQRRSTSASLDAALDVYTRQHAEKVVRKVKVYPPAPATSRYVRTGVLGRSWRVYPQRGSGAITYNISNTAKQRGKFYADYVQGTWQQFYHYGSGWKRLQENLQQETFHVGAQSIINRELGAV